MKKIFILILFSMLSVLAFGQKESIEVICFDSIVNNNQCFNCPLDIEVICGIEIKIKGKKNKRLNFPIKYNIGKYTWTAEGYNGVYHTHNKSHYRLKDFVDKVKECKGGEALELIKDHILTDLDTDPDNENQTVSSNDGTVTVVYDFVTENYDLSVPEKVVSVCDSLADCQVLNGILVDTTGSVDVYTVTLTDGTSYTLSDSYNPTPQTNTFHSSKTKHILCADAIAAGIEGEPTNPAAGDTHTIYWNQNGAVITWEFDGAIWVDSGCQNGTAEKDISVCDSLQSCEIIINIQDSVLTIYDSLEVVKDTLGVISDACIYFGETDTIQLGDTTLYVLQHTDRYGNVCKLDTICSVKKCPLFILNNDYVMVEVLDSVEYDVLFNDVELETEFDLSSFNIVSQTGGGTYTDLGDGLIKYVPDGTDKIIYDTLTYVLTDVEGCKEREAIFIVAILPPPIYECVKISGVDENGLLLIEGSGQVEDNGIWEKSIQVLVNGVWANPNSYGGGQLWIPLNSNTDPIILPFDVNIEDVTQIRECLRAIGTTFIYYDIKTLPQPEVILIGSEINLASNGDISNECYTGQEFTVIIKAYDSNYNLTEFISPAYNPIFETLDLSGLPVSLSPIFSENSSTVINYNSLNNNFQLIEVDLDVTYDYNCTNECSTTLNNVTTDLTDLDLGSSICESCESVSSVLFNSYISVSDISDVNVVPTGTPLLYTIYDVNTGNSIVTFASPHGNAEAALGYYPMNSNTTFPLYNGSFYTVVENPSCSVVCDNFTIEGQDLCTSSVQINYDGLASNATNSNILSVSPSMTTLEVAYDMQSVADQIEIFYEGILIGGTGGFVSGTGTINIPFVYNNDNFITVETSSDTGGNPLAVTVYSVSIGCCLDETNLVLPCRDPWISVVTETDCSFTVRVTMPYNASIFDGCLATNLNNIEQNGCISSPNETNIPFFQRSWGNIISLQNVAGCISNSLPNSVTTTDNGTNVVITFADAANFNAAQNYINYLSTSTSGFTPESGNSFSVLLAQNSTVNCGDDGATVGTVIVPFNTGMFQFNSGLNQITITDNVMDSNYCDFTPEDYPIQNYISLFTTVGQTNLLRIVTGDTDLGGGVTGAARTFTFDFGILQSPFTHCNDLEEYNIHFPNDSDVSSWEFWKGEVGTGTLIQSNNTSVIPSLAQSNNCTSFAALEDKNGLITQDVDYSNNTFDVSYYGGSQTMSFTSGTDLANWLSIATGATIDYIPNYEIFILDGGALSNPLENISIN